MKMSENSTFSKIIFLDFDGVITTPKSGYNLDQEKLSLLGEILEKTKAKLVISSSWRKHDLKSTITYLDQIGFPFTKHIVGVTVNLSYKFNNEIHISMARGVEIKHWINENISSPNFKYVILDDETDMLIEQMNNLVQTNTNTGLTKTEVEQSIKILNS